MKILYKTIKKLTFASMLARIEMKTDGRTLYFTVSPKNNSASLYSSALSLTVSYGGSSQTMSWSAFRTEESVTFAYSDSVKELTIAGAEITYKDVSYGTSHTFSWGGSYSDPDPTLDVTFPMGFKEDNSSEVTWTVSDPEGREYRVLGVNVTGRYTILGNHVNFVQSGYTQTSFTYAVGDDLEFSAMDYVRIEVMIGVYGSSSDDDEHYTGFAEAVSPWYVVGYADEPYPPYIISVSKPLKGQPCTIEWSPVVDADYPVTSYKLMYAVNGGIFETELLQENATSFTHTHGDSVASFRYEVRAQSQKTVGFTTTSVNSRYIVSDWYDVTSSNVYIGKDGAVCTASKMYLGKDGAVVEVSPNVTVG